MSLQNNRSRLIGLSRELLRSWHETQVVWHDQKGREFDKTYIQPLFGSVDNAAVAVEDLEKLLRKLRNDCES